MSLTVTSINEINDGDNDNNKRKIVDETNSNSSTNTSVVSNKKSKTELQAIVSVAGEILLSLLPENKTKEFPDPPMRRLNLVQQIFERNNKLIDGKHLLVHYIFWGTITNSF